MKSINKINRMLIRFKIQTFSFDDNLLKINILLYYLDTMTIYIGSKLHNEKPFHGLKKIIVKKLTP